MQPDLYIRGFEPFPGMTEPMEVPLTCRGEKIGDAILSPEGVVTAQLTKEGRELVAGKALAGFSLTRQGVELEGP